MTEAAKIELLKRLEGLGVSFSMSMPAQTHWLTIEETLQLLENPDQFILSVFGFTPEERREWTDCGGIVGCSANTKSGFPCQAVVQDAVHPIGEWVRMKKSKPLCVAHKPKL